MLYASTINASWSDVKRVEPPPGTEPGAKGPGHKPIPHREMIAKIEEVFQSVGRTCGDWRFVLAREGETDLLASCRVTSPNDSGPLCPAFGVTYSNAGRRVLTFYNGFVERETDTPIVFSSLVGGRFTHSFDLQREVEWAVAEWDEKTTHASPVRHLCTRQFTDDEIDSVMEWVYRHKIAAGSRIRRMERILAPVKKVTGLWLFRSFAQSVSGQVVPMDQLQNSYRFFVLLRGVESGLVKKAKGGTVRR